MADYLRQEVSNLNRAEVRTKHRKKLSQVKEQKQNARYLAEIPSRHHKKKKARLSKQKINWFKWLKQAHLYMGMIIGLLLVGVCIVGLIFRHPALLGIDTSLTSLNSGVFVIGSQKWDLTIVLDIVAMGCLILTISGFGLWYYPKWMKKKKEKQQKLKRVK
ncbi:hypothetical protein IC619_009905 [Hazenella sp. IB182353]|uniref:hypothetical protein n=1 Tax=Polycladospora coralii TaxID=2771432 RepID=UPI001747BC7A|nr:hypothetical protein [Polycladospora coralii]MBS7530803.1 hypothetical protein [Polycladospora coralii]